MMSLVWALSGRTTAPMEGGKDTAPYTGKTIMGYREASYTIHYQEERPHSKASLADAHCWISILQIYEEI